MRPEETKPDRWDLARVWSRVVLDQLAGIVPSTERGGKAEARRRLEMTDEEVEARRLALRKRRPQPGLRVVTKGKV